MLLASLPKDKVVTTSLLLGKTSLISLDEVVVTVLFEFEKLNNPSSISKMKP